MTHDPLCRATSGTFCDCPLIARVRDDERAAALHDAVEAVKASTTMCARPAWEMDTVVAAIESLGGER